MQFQLPQFIETEDKIVGPFSLRQFLWAGGGLAVTMFFYFTVQFIVWLPLAILSMVFGVGFAFVKVNGRPLSSIALSAFRYYWQPRIYVWGAGKPTPAGEQQKEEGGPSTLERLAQGFALSNIWERVQTGTAASNEAQKRAVGRLKERYSMFGKITGEREVAKRVDYR